jgi:hypothetical protein
MVFIGGIMINQGIDVPENTIAMFQRVDDNTVSKERLEKIIVPLKGNIKRDWFDTNFYRCTPLLIANQYGFVIKNEYTFEVLWDGTDDTSGLQIFMGVDSNGQHPSLSSHFGHGILTVGLPVVLRTPPGVNLLTIAPPNEIMPYMTVMSGAVESDNLRYTFSFNIKINEPNVRLRFEPGTSLAAFIPIPRYFADGFKLEMAEDLFEDEIVQEELTAIFDNVNYREDLISEDKLNMNRQYKRGEDIYGNKFPDHQKP